MKGSGCHNYDTIRMNLKTIEPKEGCMHQSIHIPHIALFLSSMRFPLTVWRISCGVIWSVSRYRLFVSMAVASAQGKIWPVDFRICFL